MNVTGRRVGRSDAAGLAADTATVAALVMAADRWVTHSDVRSKLMGKEKDVISFGLVLLKRS